MLVRDAKNFKEAMDEIRKYLLLLVEDGEGKPVRKKHDGDPGSYSGNFPAMVLYRQTGTDQPRFHKRPDLPGSVDFAIEFIAPSLTPMGGDRWKSGRQEAESRCEEAYSAWLEGLAGNPRMKGKLQHVAVTSDEAGDFDRLGNARSDVNTKQILWILRATVRATL